MSNSDQYSSVISIISITAVAVCLFGVVHAFTEHGQGSGFASVFVPPYALYMGLEGIFWH